jgi:hypothetical protein
VEGETTDVIICRQLSVSKGTGPGLTISPTSYNVKIRTVHHDENLVKGIASAVPNLSTLGQIIYGALTATISWFPGAFISTPP